MFKDLVGKAELDAKVVAALNLVPTMGKGVCPTVMESLIHSPARSIYGELARISLARGVDTVSARTENLGKVLYFFATRKCTGD